MNATDAPRKWFPLGGGAQALPAAAAPSPHKLLALAGHVISMDSQFAIHRDAVVYVKDGAIVAIRPRGEAAPPGFAAVAVVDTGGLIFPGLIELHNHLSYNALPLWSPVPKRYDERGEWPRHPDYRKLVSGPMAVVGKYRDPHGNAPLLAPLARFVECKCLLGGVTTSQGIMLSSNAGVQRYYRGMLRNVERSDDPALPDAKARIPDVEAEDAAAFLARLQKEEGCFLLHLSEGVTADGETMSAARKHFLALEISPGKWALNKRLAAIHAVGLLSQDFEVLGHAGASMVWSPFSNLLLYGATARVQAARDAGVRIGLGADWSPSGSKNLLGELKIAWLYSQAFLGGTFTARDLVAMVTREAAGILGWAAGLGSVTPGRRADLLVVSGSIDAPYDSLIRAKETEIRLVTIDGAPRYGLPALMGALVPDGTERIEVGGEPRDLSLADAAGDPDVAAVPLHAAQSRLRDAFLHLPQLAKELEEQASRSLVAAAPLDAPGPVAWSLALDEVLPTGVTQRPRIPFGGPGDFTGPDLAPVLAAAAPPLSTVLQPIELDAITVADDLDFLTQVRHQPNVPEAVREGLATLY